MRRLNLVQGSPEWKSARKKYRTASEASIMMAASTNVSRDELLGMKHTGTDQEFSDWFEKNVLEEGHKVEAATRPYAETLIADRSGMDIDDAELFPVTGISDDELYLASFDGMTDCGGYIWECKQMNKEKFEVVSNEGRIPECDLWQVVQQLLVSGAQVALYTVGDGTPEGTAHCWFSLSGEDADKLVAGWDQFEADLENYQAPKVKSEVVAEAVRDLPALTFNLDKTTLALSSNLGAYKAAAEQLVERSKEELTSDQQFADAAERIKVFKKSEEKLAAVIEQVQGEITDVDSFIKDVRHIAENIRKARLASEKQVEARKKQIKLDIITSAKSDLADHVAALNAELEPVALPEITADFAAAIKGKKTVNSLQSATNDALAAAKIEATQMAEQIRSNVATLADLADGYQALFPDLSSLALKSTDDFTAAVKARVAEQKEAERQREEQIRAEEAAKAEAAQPQKDSSLALEPSSEPAPSIAEIPVKPASELKAPAKTTSATRTLGDALRHFCKVKNLGEQDAQELLDIVAGYTALDVA